MLSILGNPANAAQSLIYAKTNIKRAFPDFDDSNIYKMYLTNTFLGVLRDDGGIEETYDKKKIINAFKEFTTRCPDFFSCLGPDYLGCSWWRDCSYVIYKGWHYQHQNSKRSIAARAQRMLHQYIRNNINYVHAKYSTNVDFADFLENTILYDEDGNEQETSIGHLVAPYGFKYPGDAEEKPFNQTYCNSELIAVPGPDKPFCSCASFQYQLKNLSYFQDEIPDYQPTCKHLTWYNKHIEYYCKRTKLAEQIRAGKAPNKAVAWWYAPPSSDLERTLENLSMDRPRHMKGQGDFVMLYTKDGMGASAPYKLWKRYKPEEYFTQHDVWDLFDRMIDNGYLPYVGNNLDHLKPSVFFPHHSHLLNLKSHV